VRPGESTEEVWQKHLAQHPKDGKGGPRINLHLPGQDQDPPTAKQSLIMTTNLDFSQWPQVFGSEQLTGALLDRLTHHAHILTMNGESFRFRESMSKKEG